MYIVVYVRHNIVLVLQNCVNENITYKATEQMLCIS